MMDQPDKFNNNNITFSVSTSQPGMKKQSFQKMPCPLVMLLLTNLNSVPLTFTQCDLSQQSLGHFTVIPPYLLHTGKKNKAQLL